MQIKSRLDLVQGYTCLKHVQHPFLLISITLFLVFLHLSFSSSLLLSSPSRNYYLAFNPAPQKSQQSGFIVYTTHPTHLPYSFLSSLKSKPHHFTPIFHLLCSSKCAILPNQRTGEKKKKTLSSWLPRFTHSELVRQLSTILAAKSDSLSLTQTHISRREQLTHSRSSHLHLWAMAQAWKYTGKYFMQRCTCSYHAHAHPRPLEFLLLPG